MFLALGVRGALDPVSVEIASALRKLAITDGRGELDKLLLSSDWRLRSGAALAMALSEESSTGDQARIYEMIESEDDGRALRRLAEILTLTTEHDDPWMKEGLRNSESRRHAAALWAFAATALSESPQIPKHSITGLESESELVRAAAAYSAGLAEEVPEQILKKLRQVLEEDPSSEVRAEAAAALGRIGDGSEEARLVLEQARASDHGRLSAAAKWALIRLEATR